MYKNHHQLQALGPYHIEIQKQGKRAIARVVLSSRLEWEEARGFLPTERLSFFSDRVVFNFDDLRRVKRRLRRAGWIN